MHQPRVCIHADMGLHAKVPLVALLAGVHLWIALSVLVLGGAGRCNQGGIDRSACLEQQALGCQQGVDGGQNLLGQLVFLQPVAKAQDGALIGHSAMCIKPGKLPVDRGVKEGFFHRQIRQGKPLLHAVNAQHGLQSKGWAPVLAFGVIGRNEFDQGHPIDYWVLQDFLRPDGQSKSNKLNIALIQLEFRCFGFLLFSSFSFCLSVELLH